VAALLFLVPGSARADWLLGAYMGAGFTASNTLTFTPAGGAPARFANVDYEGEAFRSPWYFGYRVARMRGDHGLGGEFEYTHAKATADDTHSPLLPQFRQTHGLNFLFGNLAYRTRPACSGRCSFSVRGGLGVTRPHVETTVSFQQDVHQEQYQWGGIAWQAGAGVEFKVWSHFYTLADVRITRVTEKHLRAAGANIAGSFFTTHLDFGLGLHLPY
jgi:opacity protein-like surface antigen